MNILDDAHPARPYNARRPGLLRLLSALGVSMVLLAGCGGGGGDPPPASAAPSESGGATGTPDPGGDPDDSDDGDDTGDDTGDDGSGDGDDTVGLPGSPIVYLATQDDAATPELYLVTADTAGASTKLNPPLVADGAVEAFAIGPNGERVAYIAAQDSATESELYVVALDAPGVATKLSLALPANGTVTSFAFAPDGASIAYAADADAAGQTELYLVEIATADGGVKLNDPLQAGGNVQPAFRFSPDGTQVLYAADRDTDEFFDLFLVDTAAPGTPATVNPALVANGSVTESYEFSPDGTWIGYIADQDTDDVLELYAVPTATPGTSSKLNGTLAAGGDLCNFVFDPTSQRVAYCAEEETNGVIELFIVELTAPGVTTKLNSPLVAGGRVTDYTFGADGDFLIYRADQETDDAYELYRVDLTNPGVGTKINGALVAGGSVDLPVILHRPEFMLTPDDLKVVYAADQDIDQQFDLYSVELSAAGAPAKLTPALVGRGVDQFQVTADSTSVVYHALQDSGTLRIYSVDILAPGTTVELSGPIAPGGRVIDFAIAPGFRQLD
jgi:Tol biopolymer transport system component